MLRRLLLISILLLVCSTLYSQIKYCKAIASTPQVSLNNVSTDVSKVKTIRVVVHFPLRANGTDNFTETKDCYGKVCSYNGYWFAENFIERANYCLQNNVEMRRQLKGKPIPVKDINIQFELAGVMFDRSTTTTDYYKLVLNNDVYTLINSINLGNLRESVPSDILSNAVHLFLYKEAWGKGYSDCAYSGLVSGVANVYDGYTAAEKEDSKLWYFQGYIGTAAIHEVGHCLSLNHPNQTGDGTPTYSDDGCADTPTRKELEDAGYTTDEIYAWNDHDRGSNNVMDYNASQRAWTPNQIERAHKTIESKKSIKQNEFSKSTQTVSGTIKNNNKVVIAKSVTVSNTSVKNGRALYVNCDEVLINGEFTVESGCEFVAQ